MRRDEESYQGKMPRVQQSFATMHTVGPSSGQVCSCVRLTLHSTVVLYKVYHIRSLFGSMPIIHRHSRHIFSCRPTVGTDLRAVLLPSPRQQIKHGQASPVSLTNLATFHLSVS